MLYDTVAEYDTAIEAARLAHDRALRIGLHSKNVTGASERSNTEVDLPTIVAHLQLLRRERKALQSNLRGRSIGAGW